jgi:molybdopterin synthase catalytic subunit
MATKWLFSLHFQAVNNKENSMGTVMESKVRIQREDFSVTDEIEAIKKSSANIGGIVVFLGTGRELSKGQNISKLNFEHYPKMAEKKLEELRLKAIEDHKIIDMSIIHRIGEIDIGENIVRRWGASEGSIFSL